MKIYYRISNKSYPKIKLPGATKEFCLINFLEVFPKDSITVICDNCSKETIKMVSDKKVDHVITELSNAGALNWALNQALSLEDETIVYFVEDDYIHDVNSKIILQEGMPLADYLTLYDHPDKYQSEYNSGEVSVVKRTNNSHWRETISTCMTFATLAKNIKRDIDVWRKYTQSTHPHDHQIFSELKAQGRNLILSIPGRAFHCDLTYYMQKNITNLIDQWVIDVLATQLTQNMSWDIFNQTESFKGLNKLFMLDCLQKNPD